MHKASEPINLSSSAPESVFLLTVVTPALALVGGYNWGNYTEILDDHPVGENPLNLDDSSTKRHTLFGALRWTVLPSKRLSPYLQGGLNLSFGKIAELSGDSGYRSAFGPVAGIGLDYVISPKASIFLETTGFYGFPDDALDAQDPEVEDDETDFDLLGFYGGPEKQPLIQRLSMKMPVSLLLTYGTLETERLQKD